MKTILITGCSSGFGLEIARYFLDRDWTVIATMRRPREDLLPRSGRLRLLALDVDDAASIREAVAAAGPIDVLVNNAGFGATSPFETLPMAAVRGMFETNAFGTMALTQAVLPQFRERGEGVVVNVTSSVTYRPVPLTAGYRASKAAVNAFTEVLAQEVAPFGVRVHLVLPGRAPETRFADNARAHSDGAGHGACAEMVRGVFAQFTGPGPVTRSLDVAEAVWRAATDPSCPLRLPAGEDALVWAGSA